MTTKSERKFYIALFPNYIAMTDEHSLIVESPIKSPKPYATYIPFKSDPTLLVLEKGNEYSTTILPNNGIPIKYKMDVESIEVGKDSVTLNEKVLNSNVQMSKVYQFKEDDNWKLRIYEVEDKPNVDSSISIYFGSKENPKKGPSAIGTDFSEYYATIEWNPITFKVHQSGKDGEKEVLTLPSVGSIPFRDTPPVVIPIEGESRAQKAFGMLERYFNDKMMF